MALPAFFDPLVYAPRWQKVALGLVGLAVVGAGGYFLLLSPTWPASAGRRRSWSGGST
jgi:hypothetical protein